MHHVEKLFERSSNYAQDADEGNGNGGSSGSGTSGGTGGGTGGGTVDGPPPDED